MLHQRSDHLGRFDVQVRDEEAASSSLGGVVVVGEGALARVEAAPAPPARAVVGVGGQEVDLNTLYTECLNL